MKIDKIIKKYDYISFDMFDTLITRNLEKPMDLFFLIERKLKEKKINCNNFYQQRIGAEKEARNNIKTEVTINDIYKYFKIKDKNILRKIIQTEIETELEICEINNNFIDIYNLAVKLNKKIIIATDMYLPEEIIKKILEKNHIKYDKLFLSSKLKKTKQSGELYKYILINLHIKPSQIVHFGDNKKSDYIKPKFYGIKSYLVKKNINIVHYDKKCENINYKAMINFQNNHIGYTNDYYEKLGYIVFGPLLYFYVKWLEENFKENNYDHIFFLSRDGKIMQNAFKLINKDIKSEYFYASRRALTVPILCTSRNFDDMISLMHFSKSISLEGYLKKLGIENKRDEIKNQGYDLSKKYNILLDDDRKKLEMITNKYIEDINKNSTIELEAAKKYFREKNFRGNVAIVDIGWYGNMQRAIIKICDIAKINCKVDGYYVGIVPYSKLQKQQIMHGYLFEKGRNEELFYQKKFFNAFFEMCFMADHGSVKKYGKKVELYDFEYKGDDTEKIFKKIQKGALKFIEQYNNSNIRKYITISPEYALINFIKFGNYPSLKDLKMFKNIKFLDDDLSELIVNHSIGFYIFHPKIFKLDFQNSYWKTAFLKQLFKINMDYYEIIMRLRRKIKTEEGKE